VNHSTKTLIALTARMALFSAVALRPVYALYEATIRLIFFNLSRFARI